MNSLDKPTRSKERDELEQAIATLEEKRSLLGAEIVDIAIASMREKLAGLGTGSRVTHEPQQRKLVTVLFADVSGFTAMAERMAALPKLEMPERTWLVEMPRRCCCRRRG